MKKERMAILKMINDGKITVDEAVKLMESMKENKAINPSDIISGVKDKVCDIVDEAKPVVKKCANKAMEVGNDVYNMGKAKVEEYKSKAKNKDFVEDVIVEPVSNVVNTAMDAGKDVKDAVVDAKEYVAETAEEAKDEVKDAVVDAVKDVKEKIEE